MNNTHYNYYKKENGFLKSKNINFVASVLITIGIVFPQVAGATMYQPGGTLDPDCAPGSVNCGVLTDISNIGNSNLTLDSSRTLNMNSHALTLHGALDTVFGDNGDILVGGSLTVADGKISLGPNIQGSILVSDGMNFFPVVPSGDAIIYGSGVIAINYSTAQSADSTNKGFLTSADWNTFNNKQSALGYTPLNPNNNLSDIVSAGISRANLGLGNLATQNGTFSGTSSGINTGDQTNITGNAGTATALQNPRTINGISFNGTSNITVASAAGTLTGSTLNSGVTASSLTSVGTLSSLVVSGAINIGNNANAKTITIGNATGATSVVVNSGTGGIVLNGVLANSNQTVLCINASNQLVRGANNTSCNASSLRYKHDVENLSSGLGIDAVMALRPVSFTYNPDVAGDNPLDQSKLGFIAEEAALVDPRLAFYDSNGVVQAIDPDEFSAILTKAIQQQQVLLGDISPKINADGSDNGLASIISTVQSEGARDPVVIISKKIADGKQFLADFVSARVTAIHGYFDEVFSQKIHTSELCVKKSDNNEVCVNGDQINSLLNANDNPPTRVDPTPTPSVDPTPVVDAPIESSPDVTSAPEIPEPASPDSAEASN